MRTALYRTAFGVLALLASAAPAHAQNPIVPPGVYIADPSARVWPDGRLYVYGSRDESPDYYCSTSYRVLSTPDLLRWTLTGTSFATSGEGDEVPYSDSILYAPDATFRDGTYYLYYCLAQNTLTEGVATSTSPTGPFVRGRPLDTKGINQIDPAVFVDDDGQAYYIWGQFSAKMAKLKPNMVEIDPATVKENVLTEREHRFHEGGYMVKRGGIYYFVYAHLNEADMPTQIGYATSRSPTGPFRHGGVIVDNDHCDPGNWNNHGSLVEFKGRWYVFYHRSTHGSNTMRKACVEPITFRRDGSIPRVEMTTQGAGPPLSAFAEIDAARACLLHGGVRIVAVAADNEALAGIRAGDKAAYKYVDFGPGVKGFAVRVAPGARPGSITAYADNAWSRPVATVRMPAGGDGRSWVTLRAAANGTRGVHSLWLRFEGEGDSAFKVDSFWFE